MCDRVDQLPLFSYGRDGKINLIVRVYIPIIRLLKVGGLPSPIFSEFRLWHIFFMTYETHGRFCRGKWELRVGSWKTHRWELENQWLGVGKPMFFSRWWQL